MISSMMLIPKKELDFYFTTFSGDGRSGYENNRFGNFRTIPGYKEFSDISFIESSSD